MERRHGFKSYCACHSSKRIPYNKACSSELLTQKVSERCHHQAEVAGSSPARLTIDKDASLPELENSAGQQTHRTRLRLVPAISFLSFPPARKPITPRPLWRDFLRMLSEAGTRIRVPASEQNSYYLAVIRIAPAAISKAPAATFHPNFSPKNSAARTTTNTILNLSMATTLSANPYLRARK